MHWPFIRYKNFRRSFFHFVTIHAFDKCTDRQTDGWMDRCSLQYCAACSCSMVKVDSIRHRDILKWAIINFWRGRIAFTGLCWDDIYTASGVLSADQLTDVDTALLTDKQSGRTVDIWPDRDPRHFTCQWWITAKYPFIYTANKAVLLTALQQWDLSAPKFYCVE